MNCLKARNFEKEEAVLKIIEELAKMLSFEQIKFEEIFELFPHQKSKKFYNYKFIYFIKLGKGWTFFKAFQNKGKINRATIFY